MPKGTGKEVGNRARPRAARLRQRGTPENRNQRMGNPTLTEMLVPAEGWVKQNLPGPEARACQAGQTGSSAPAIRAPACRWPVAAATHIRSSRTSVSGRARCMAHRVSQCGWRKLREA